MKSLSRLLAGALALLCVGLASAPAQKSKGGDDDESRAAAGRLYPVMSKFKTGFIDRAGKLVIEPKYDTESTFSEGLAVVSSGLLTEGLETAEPVGNMVTIPVGPEGYKWEIIDAKGKTVAKLPLDRQYHGTTFADGLAWFSVWVYGKGSVYGYMDRAGAVVVEPRFIRPGRFREGLAEACEEFERCGFIDRAGKYVVPPKYKEARPFYDGLAAVVTQDDLTGFVDKTGEMVIEPRFGPLSDEGFAEGLAPIAVAGSDRFGYIDKQGAFQIQPAFEAAMSFSDGLAPAKSGGKWGYIDRSGKFVIPPQFAAAQPFSEGLAAASRCEGVLYPSRGEQTGPCGYGYLDKSGKFVIEERFDQAEQFRDGVAHVIERGGRGWVARDGSYIWKPSK